MIPNRILHIQTNGVNWQKRLRVIDDWQTPSENTIAEAVVTDSRPLIDAVAQAMADTYLVSRVIENGTFKFNGFREKPIYAYGGAK